MSARPRIAAHSEPVAEDDGVRWLAMLIRQGLLLIVRGIEFQSPPSALTGCNGTKSR